MDFQRQYSGRSIFDFLGTWFRLDYSKGPLELQFNCSLSLALLVDPLVWYNLVDVSDIFLFFFCSGAGEKEEASEEVAGGSVLTKNRGRGGGFRGGGVGGERALGECLWGEGGG